MVQPYQVSCEARRLPVYVVLDKDFTFLKKIMTLYVSLRNQEGSTHSNPKLKGDQPLQKAPPNWPLQSSADTRLSLI